MRCTNCEKEYEVVPTTILHVEGNLRSHISGALSLTKGWEGNFCSKTCREEYEKANPNKFKTGCYYLETIWTPPSKRGKGGEKGCP